MIRLRSLLAVSAALVVAVAAASAQTAAPAGENAIGLYLNPVAIRVSNSTNDPTNFSFLGPGVTSRVFWGVHYGGYYEFFHTGSLNVGGDLRGSDLHANNASLKDLLVGVRVSGRLGETAWHPYGEALIGGGWTKAPASAVSIRKVQYRVYGGVDRPLARHVDLRAIEIGYGTLQTISSATVGNGGNIAIPASGLLSFSSGLVFRF